MTRALVVEHIEREGSGAFLDWLPAAGLDLDVHLVQRDGPPPPRLPARYGALVVMGGAMGVHDLDPAEHELVRTCDRPYLGICLGAQLLAEAAGGRVTKGRIGPELGLGTVHLHPAAHDDALLHGLPDVVNAVQWHWDEILTLPPGATLLGGSAAYPHQAFRVGSHAWGLQFHPEARPSMVRRWAVEDANDVREAGEDPDTHAADVARAWPDLENAWVKVASRFAGYVQDAAGTASKSPGGLPVGGL